MFLLNKVSTRRPSLKQPSKQIEPDETMMYMNGNSNGPRTRERKPSRVRSSFFGGSKRRSGLESEAPEGPAAPIQEMNETESPSRFSEETDSGSISIYTRRRRLRKMTSKGSLASIAISEASIENKTKSRLFPDALFKTGNQARERKGSISSPFNFTHITQVHPRDASRLRYNAEELGEEWNKALHRESQSRPGTAQTYIAAHIREDSTTTVETVRARSRSDSVKSVSPPEVNAEIASVSPRSSVQYTCPITPPQRSSSRHCVIIPEHPDEELPEEAQNDGDVPDDVTLGAVPEEEEDTCIHAVTTPGDSCSGRKSIGIERVLCHAEVEDSVSEMGVSDVPEIREPELLLEQTECDISNTGFNPQMFLSVRSRPISQLSAVSDTLSGNFIVPLSPIGHGSMRARRVSRRLSAHMKLHGGFTMDADAIDSWEQDIDWCYEHEAEADCDFDWDKNSSYAGSNFDEQETADQSPVYAPASAAVLESNTNNVSKSELLDIPEETKEQTSVLAERRITGIFEDRLLLPPSPRFTPSCYGFSPSSSVRPRDSGFDSCSIDDHSLVMRVSSTPFRHRSISSTPSLPDLNNGRSYRDELYRVATQLDEHIAALNKELYTPSMAQPPKRMTSVSEKVFTGNRSRAGSQTTCVTLCSDSDTITPIETNEAITPSGSAHNSFQFARQRSVSAGAYAMAIEGRMEKGLSYAAAAIPGVVELGPDSTVPGMFPEEQEFVHYI